jgi:hypothetical protein
MHCTGTVWCWDLSATLGWAADPGPCETIGSQTGTWHELSDTPWKVSQRRGSRPVPIASFPSPQGSLPVMLMPREPECEFACLCARPGAGAAGSERLVLARMLPVGAE